MYRVSTEVHLRTYLYYIVIGFQPGILRIEAHTRIRAEGLAWAHMDSICEGLEWNITPLN